MSEHQETVHVVLRTRSYFTEHEAKAAKVFDDRADARAYAKRMNGRSRKYVYTVQSCKKG